MKSNAGSKVSPCSIVMSSACVSSFTSVCSNGAAKALLPPASREEHPNKTAKNPAVHRFFHVVFNKRSLLSLYCFLDGQFHFREYAAHRKLPCFPFLLKVCPESYIVLLSHGTLNHAKKELLSQFLFCTF